MEASDTLRSVEENAPAPAPAPTETATSPETPTPQVVIDLQPHEDAPSSTLKRKRQHGEDVAEKKQNLLAEEEEADTEANANASGGEDLTEKRQHPLWKTSLCSYFRRSEASCSHGSACRYAHGEAELRPRPDNTWDPTSEKGKSSNSHLVSDRHEMEFDNSPLPVQDVLECSDDDDDEESAGHGRLDKCIIGLPMKWTSEKLQGFLDGEGIHCKTVRKKKGMTVGFLGFEDDSQLESAIERLSGKSIGRKDIKISDVFRKTYVKKAKLHVPEDGISLSEVEKAGSVDADAGDSVPKTRSVRDTVVPLSHMPYEEQLEYKKNSLAQILKRLTRNARKACPGSVSLPEWILRSREIGGLPCKFEGILPSPSTQGYRNKCEFTVGYSLQGKKTVGFALGNFREGMIAIEEPSDCSNISEISCKYAMIFQDFLDTSALPVWSRLNNTGFWRQLTVREGRGPGHDTSKVSIAEVMLIIQVCSLDVDEELMNKEFKKMAECFARGASSCQPQLPLTSLVVQDHKGISNAAPTESPLFPIAIPSLEGEGDQSLEVPEARIQDFLCNLKFCISPTAFFQVNTLAAEKLYSLAGDWAYLTTATLLFDICCGTGTIGLTLAHRVGMVVGIEMNHSAVLDAQRNADINGITNCKFVCGKAEDVMGTLLKEYICVSQEQGNANDEDMVEIPDEVDRPECPSDNSLSANGGSEFLVNSEGRETRSLSEMDSSECLLQSYTTEHKETGAEDAICKQREGVNALQFEDVVVIVDPPRAGLHPVVIKALRTHPRLRRLVYISCNPETLVANAIELCTPTTEDREKTKGNKQWRKMSNAGLARHRTKSMPHSEPFRPMRAMAVDMFPHTPHCEMVMLFER